MVRRGTSVQPAEGQWLRGWLEQGLKEVGEEWHGGWLGSPASGARFLVHEPHPPFRWMEVTLLLENREIPILWLADRLQGKRDALIIRARCASPGKGAFHAGPPSQVLVPPYLSWHQEKGPHGLVVASRDPRASRRIEEITRWLDRYGPHLRHLGLQDNDPHLSVWVNVSELARNTPAATFLRICSPSVGDNRPRG